MGGGLFDGDYLHRPLAARETKQGDVTVRSDLTPPSLSLHLDIIHLQSHAMGYKSVYIPCLNHFIYTSAQCTHNNCWITKTVVK